MYRKKSLILVSLRLARYSDESSVPLTGVICPVISCLAVAYSSLFPQVEPLT